MKKLKLLVLLTILIGACSKNNDKGISEAARIRDLYPSERQPEGKYVRMVLDGQPVDFKNVRKGLFNPYYPRKFTLSFYTNLKYTVESFRIGLVPMKVGKTRIEGESIRNTAYYQINCTGSMTNKGTDVGNDYYIADTNANNFIEVQYFNETTKEARGIFQMTLYRQSIGLKPPSYTNLQGDTIHITNGEFDVFTGFEPTRP